MMHGQNNIKLTREFGNWLWKVVVFTGNFLFTLLKTSQLFGQKCGNSTSGIYILKSSIMYYWMSPPDRGIYSGVSGRREENHERFESWLFGFFV